MTTAACRTFGPLHALPRTQDTPEAERDFFDVAGHAFLQIGLDGTIERSNRAFDNLFGYELGTLVGKHLSRLFPEFSPAALVSREGDRFDCGSAIGPCVAGVLANGRDGCFDLRCSPTRDHRSCILSVVDVTEREELRRDLFESQQINRTGTWSFDLEKDEVRWSPELFRILDLPPAEIAPPFETHHLLFTPESWARLEPAVQAATEGTAYEIELQLARTDDNGGPCYAIARCEPQKDRAGRVYRLVGTFQDVTELVRTRRRHDQLLQRIAMATSAARIGVWEWDVARDELVFDRQSRELYGFDATEALDLERWKSRLIEADQQRTMATIRRALEKNEPWNASFRIAHPSRGILHLRGAGRTQTAADGTLSKLVGVSWDVSEQVQLENEARKVQNLESLGVLAGGIAHDFNNLLTGILGRAELLIDPDVDDRAELAEGIVEAVQRSTRLTAQLMTFAKGGEPVLDTGSIRELVHKTIDFTLRGSSTCVVYDLPEDLWGVAMDEGKIGQVIQNLALNADQAIGPGGGTFTIRGRNVTAAAGEDSRPSVELLFEDDGPGVPTEVAARIFDPYFSTKPTGHGLGLAICHSIVERHSGNLSLLAPHPGRGATFRLLLPAAREAVPSHDQTTRRARRFGAGRSILLVDDNEDVRKTIRLELNLLGFLVEEATTVHEALEIALPEGRRSAHAAIITDLTIPGTGGGIELFERVRAAGVDTPMVLISGYTSRSGLQDRFDAVLDKPVRLRDLSAALAQVLDDRSLPDPAPEASVRS